MKEKYCDINYRGYLLEILRDEYLPGKFRYTGSSKDISYFSQGLYSYIHHPINKFIDVVDETLGEREKEEEILFCTVIYQKYELKIWVKDDLYYMAWIDNFDFASWGENWRVEKLVSIIEAFRKKVDSATGEDLITAITDYHGHRLVVRKKKDSSRYIGTSTFLDGKWKHEDYDVNSIVKRHQIEIGRPVESNKMTEKTYEEVKKEWGSNHKKVTYKNQVMRVTALKRVKDSRVFYAGVFSYKPQNEYWSKNKSIESIHYDKVIYRFERFVDEYCTNWEAKAEFTYKGYLVKICKERDKEFYLGIVQFHKNSTYKHIADTREEVERCCRNRIGKVIYEKGKVQRNMLTPKQEKIKELEELLVRVSTQLEELKNKKDSLTYKGVVLEISKSNSGRYYGTLKDITKPAPFIENNLEELQKSFESYIDRLEGQYIFFCRLTGKS